MPDDSDAADKSTLRAIARQRRRNFVASLDALTHRLAFKAVPSPLAQRIADAQVIALYMALDDEAPAQRLAPQLGVMGKQVALPRKGAQAGLVGRYAVVAHQWSALSGNDALLRKQKLRI